MKPEATEVLRAIFIAAGGIAYIPILYATYIYHRDESHIFNLFEEDENFPYPCSRVELLLLYIGIGFWPITYIVGLSIMGTEVLKKKLKSFRKLPMHRDRDLEKIAKAL